MSKAIDLLKLRFKIKLWLTQCAKAAEVLKGFKMNSLEVLTEVFNASNNFDALKGFVVAFAYCKRNLKAELDALKKQADQDATFSDYWRAVIESAFKVVCLIIEGNAVEAAAAYSDYFKNNVSLLPASA